MNRKSFLKKTSLLGMGTIVGIPTTVAAACSNPSDTSVDGDCDVSPRETAGPFPNKSPADLVRENIIGDRSGVALLVNLTVIDSKNDCQPLANALVDIWHCDAKGIYSEYGGNRLQSGDYTNAHFLRGRQSTDKEGHVSFVSIFPGWYPGRAPHLHIEVLKANGQSVLVTQIAFPESVCNTVYETEAYRGKADVSNRRDGVFRNSLDENMADSVSGDLANGYVLEKKVVV